MSFDALVIAAHPDDAETQMGGTLAKLTDAGLRILLIDLTEGEPTEFAARGVRARQASEAVRILDVSDAEIYRGVTPVLVDTPIVFRPAVHS